jgi:glyoxylase-like metal-dependent hydrolase (beta-lactamase superfamily II)
MPTPLYTLSILVEGYVRRRPDGGWLATSTTTLITAPGAASPIVVDPGCNRDLLLAALAVRSLSVDAISTVFLTHHHVDHALNAALFPRARVVDHEAVYAGDRASPVGDTLPDTAIAILPTPGHAEGHASLLVPTDRGSVVVAGDVFWWAEGEPPGLDLDRPDAFATDPVRLRESRLAVLRLADWVVPGHGPLWPVERRTPAR